jgi:hypothetical protein
MATSDYKDEAVRLLLDRSSIYWRVSRFINQLGANCENLEAMQETETVFLNSGGKFVQRYMPCLVITGEAYVDFLAGDAGSLCRELRKLARKLKEFGQEVLEANSRRVYIADKMVNFTFIIPIQEPNNLPVDG